MTVVASLGFTSARRQQRRSAFADACASHPAAFRYARARKGTAIQALRRIHSQPETVVPALMELLQAHDTTAAYQAAMALGERFRCEARRSLAD